MSGLGSLTMVPKGAVGRWCAMQANWAIETDAHGVRSLRSQARGRRSPPRWVGGQTRASVPYTSLSARVTNTPASSMPLNLLDGDDGARASGFLCAARAYTCIDRQAPKSPPRPVPEQSRGLGARWNRSRRNGAALSNCTSGARVGWAAPNWSVETDAQGRPLRRFTSCAPVLGRRSFLR